MAPAFVQFRQGINASVTSATIAFNSSTTAGNLLLITLVSAQGTPTTLGVSDNLGNVWTPLHGQTPVVGGGNLFQTWWAISKGGACTITCTASPTTFLVAYIGEFTWPSTTASLDGSPQFAGSTTAVSTLPNLTVVASGTSELAWGASVVNAGGIGGNVVNAPFTILGGGQNEWAAYDIISSPGAVTYGGSYTGSGANGSYAIVLNPAGRRLRTLMGVGQ